jgi:hypothetical protein
MYGVSTYEARVLLGRAARKYREGRLEDAAALARHSKRSARVALTGFALKIAERISALRVAGAEEASKGLSTLAREDPQAAIREAARFGGVLVRGPGEADREFALAAIAAAWELMRQVKSKGVDVTGYEIDIRQARSALDLADAPRAVKLAGKVREELEARIQRLARESAGTTRHPVRP